MAKIQEYHQYRELVEGNDVVYNFWKEHEGLQSYDVVFKNPNTILNWTLNEVLISGSVWNQVRIPSVDDGVRNPPEEFTIISRFEYDAGSIDIVDITNFHITLIDATIKSELLALYEEQKLYLEELRDYLLTKRHELNVLKINLEQLDSMRDDEIVNLVELIGSTAIGGILSKIAKAGSISKDAEILFELGMAGKDVGGQSEEAISARIDVLTSAAQLVPGVAGVLARSLSLSKDIGEGLVGVSAVYAMKGPIENLERRIGELASDIAEVQLRYDAAAAAFDQTYQGVSPSPSANQHVEFGGVHGVRLVDKEYGTQSAHELIVGTAGQSEFVSVGSQNKTVQMDLGDGLDTSRLEGFTRASSSILSSEGAAIVSNGVRIVVAENVERLVFDDGILALDISGNAGQAYRLYQAAFERTPDSQGLKYWVNQLDSGYTTLAAVADSFLKSPEFVSTFGTEQTVANGRFVELLYTHTLGRDFDREGYAYWVGKLTEGATNRGDLLAFFSESNENKARVADAIDDGIWLT